MKTTDLMIGDWVCLVNPDTKKRTNTKVYGSDLCGGGVLCLQWFEQIPLTPEILEKNGFIECQYWHEYKEGDVIIQSQIPNVRMKNGLKEFSTDSCESVHELQHALKLCGIEKEIIL